MRIICFGISCIILLLGYIHLEAQDLEVAGNIGIGTIPDTKLDVNGTVKIRELPPGEGTPLVADEAGNLYVSDGISSNDSLTYTIVTGFGPAIAPGTYALGGLNVGGSTGEGIMTFNLTKGVDRNTAGFLTLFATQPSNSVVIEINVYEAGSSTPYASHKFSELQVVAYSQGYPDGKGQSESFTIGANVYGFKDHVSGASFAFNITDNMQIPY